MKRVMKSAGEYIRMNAKDIILGIVCNIACLAGLLVILWSAYEMGIPM